MLILGLVSLPLLTRAKLCGYLSITQAEPMLSAIVLNSIFSALNKTFMESEGIGQLSRFHCIINYGTQIMSLKKSQSATNIWNFP